MANRITIRQGTQAPQTGDLLPYELGWDSTNGILYIGASGNNSPIPVGIQNVNSIFLPLAGGTITGNITYHTQPLPGFYIGTTAPSSMLSTLSNGDIYIHLQS